ncbi:uncharacterized protein LOC117870055 [Trachemys scripta elegans]|uniref:uncharacterized protein LOC117870055 n=1 Tax=Trachemys scripta elegans TaxID=31138 RepID=UPI001554B884|nr:uncharacterized protein LOC117870055 [Trachemys scripta elegans]
MPALPYSCHQRSPAQMASCREPAMASCREPATPRNYHRPLACSCGRRKMAPLRPGPQRTPIPGCCCSSRQETASLDPSRPGNPPSPSCCSGCRVRTIAMTALRTIVEKRIGRPPSDRDMATFLSGSLDGEFARDRGDIASLWFRARNATRRLGKRLGCRWVWNEERRELGILIPQIESEDNTVITPGARGILERSLKAAVHALYVDTLKKKPDQGKAFEVTSKWDSSNHFLPTGSFTRFADWRFIHRARLNCVPLNGAVRHGNWDKRRRKCGYVAETLPQVLCSCKPHARAWQL